jgi:hypothetical protein
MVEQVQPLPLQAHPLPMLAVVVVKFGRRAQVLQLVQVALVVAVMVVKQVLELPLGLTARLIQVVELVAVDTMVDQVLLFLLMKTITATQ